MTTTTWTTFPYTYNANNEKIIRKFVNATERKSGTIDARLFRQLAPREVPTLQSTYTINTVKYS